MAKGNGEAAPLPAAPVLAVGLGRGFGGKSTGLSELVWRARNQGRDVIVADGDARSKTLASMFPDATCPCSEELPEDSESVSGGDPHAARTSSSGETPVRQRRQRT